jgi:hypothetical protein
MTSLEGMHSYFWLASSRLREPIRDEVPYTTQALRQDLLRVRNAWDECQSSRDRNAIYGYLTAVFDLVMWWIAEDRAISRARWALQLQRLELPTTDEPFAAIILATADRQKVDKRTRSKWSRVLRYAAEYKANSELLVAFVQRKGGINKCPRLSKPHSSITGRRSNSTQGTAKVYRKLWCITLSPVDVVLRGAGKWLLPQHC